MVIESISAHDAEEWINGLAAFDTDNKIILLSIFATFGIPTSFLDVGSGDGAMVNFAERMGVEVNGIDQLPRPNHPLLIQWDLTQPINLERKYDIVSCIETAEHLPPEAADRLVQTVTHHARHYIVFTSAMPGQPGKGHVNLQSAYYWREKFYDKGWDYNAPDTYRLALMLKTANHASHHVEANLQVFRPLYSE